jgi:hypothetical protein
MTWTAREDLGNCCQGVRNQKVLLPLNNTYEERNSRKKTFII